MKLVTRNGHLLGGPAALAEIARHIVWARPIAWMWQVHFCRPFIERLYTWIATHRHCLSGTCSYTADLGRLEQP
jgi:hypothetical protein